MGPTNIAILASATDPRWVDAALSDLDAVLSDHLHCERKAAQSGPGENNFHKTCSLSGLSSMNKAEVLKTRIFDVESAGKAICIV